jgi:hypothetical protein
MPLRASTDGLGELAMRTVFRYALVALFCASLALPACATPAPSQISWIQWLVQSINRLWILDGEEDSHEAAGTNPGETTTEDSPEHSPYLPPGG